MNKAFFCIKYLLASMSVCLTKIDLPITGNHILVTRFECNTLLSNFTQGGGTHVV